MARQLAVSAADSGAATTLDPLPATTLLLAQLISAPGRPVELTIGCDTRAYLLTRDPATARRLTDDESYTGEVSSQLSGWLAGDHTPEPTVRTVPVEPGLLVLTTDGAWSPLGAPADMVALLNSRPEAWTDTALAAELLTQAARATGSGDDITVAVIALPER